MRNAGVMLWGIVVAGGCFADPDESDPAASTGGTGTSTATTTSVTSATPATGETTVGSTSSLPTSGSSAGGSAATSAASGVTSDGSASAGSGTASSSSSSTGSAVDVGSTAGFNPLAECEGAGFGFPDGPWVSGFPVAVCYPEQVSAAAVEFQIDGLDYAAVLANGRPPACPGEYWTLASPPTLDVPPGLAVGLSITGDAGDDGGVTTFASCQVTYE